jgi:hypothetical protein
VQDYRRLYGIRSRNHPMPDLAVQGEWHEAPFWAWRRGQKRRGRLFARRTAAAVELRVGDEIWPTLPLPAGGNGAAAAAAWCDLETQGFKVRSRALTNTLYARLFLADLFIHGIGGGKYDEVTDAIVRRFYGIEPPEFVVLSATLLLPLPSFAVSAEDCRQLARRLRDLHYNPQRHLDVLAAGEARRAALELAGQKAAWITRPAADKRERRQRYRTLRSLTEQLGSFLDGREQDYRRELARCDERLQANAVLRRRDFAFCLYPESELRSLYTPFLQGDFFREPQATAILQ